MYSPSAELNAYILDYKARKSLQNSPYSTPTKKTLHSSTCSSKSWLQEVLEMPPEYKKQVRSNVNDVPKTSDNLSVAKWLHEIDEKISKRFPPSHDAFAKYTTEMSFNHGDSMESDLDKTLELITADPVTGLNSCSCASYDSHICNSKSFKDPNLIKDITQDGHYCNCDHSENLRASAWVDDVINEDLCTSCIERENDHSKYRPTKKNTSTNLPDGYKLFDSKKKSKSRKSNQTKSKRKSVSPNKNLNINDSSSAQRNSPETENIMRLLERAIDQLQEVKGAVEDNTVSAITSDVSIVSQALSELPID